MRLHILSDLHIERWRFTAQPVIADVTILAGDIQSPGVQGVKWAARSEALRHRPVIYVPGNHEAWDGSVGTLASDMARQAQGSNVHVLQRGELVISGVRFLGCTLWTDMLLPHNNGTPGAPLLSNVEQAMAWARQRINDFHHIGVKYVDRGRKDQAHQNLLEALLTGGTQLPKATKPVTRRRPLTPEEMVGMHWVDRIWLANKLREPHCGPTVVVTHHAPSNLSVANEHFGSPLSPCFASDVLADFDAQGIPLPIAWAHGHIHSSSRRMERGCEVVCNPRGNPLATPRDDGSLTQNAEFDPGLVIEV